MQIAIRLYSTGDHWRARVVTEGGTPLFTSEGHQVGANEALDAMARGRALAEARKHVSDHNLMAGESE